MTGFAQEIRHSRFGPVFRKTGPKQASQKTGKTLYKFAVNSF
jgi:hypothetical protein